MDEFENVDLSQFGFHEPTEEEIQERKIKHAKEISEKGFLPENEGYSETMNSPQEYVESNPRQFIIEECVPACEELWSKNIYTFMVSDHLNEGVCWVEIIYDYLSEENKKIYAELNGDDIVKFSYHPGAVNFGIKKVGLEGQEKLLELAKRFKMQDVPKKGAYIDEETFLIDYCNCYDEVENPEYVEMTSPWDANISLEEMGDYLIKYDEWESSIKSKPTIRVYNPNKKEKSLEELVLEHNMILEGDRIYLSQFHYDKHQNYINSLNETKSTISLK